MFDEDIQDDTIVTFGYIPQLGPGVGTLMPNSGGRPGVTYAQVCTHNLVRAMREGWEQVKDSEPYVVVGPSGEAAVMLLCSGKPIRGGRSASGACKCKIDREIYTLTGFEDPDACSKEEPDGTEKPRVGQNAARPKESKPRDEGIQARQPSI
jgi:hypothetical protein